MSKREFLLQHFLPSLSYSIFILNASTAYVMAAALINTGVVIYILYKQFLSLSEHHNEDAHAV